MQILGMSKLPPVDDGERTTTESENSILMDIEQAQLDRAKILKV
jgi:hypothetical protein